MTCRALVQRCNLKFQLMCMATAMLLLAAPHVRAEDIDIFSASSSEQGAQNVLLMLDNSANWSAAIGVPACTYADGSGGPKSTNPNSETGAKMSIEKCALYNALYRLPVPTGEASPYFNIGVMLFNEGNTNSGYPRSRFLPLTAANKAALLDVIRSLGINADKTNNASTAESFYEAFQMFTAGAVWKGKETPAKYDHSAISGTKYVGTPNAACNNHIVYIANGKPQDNNATALERLTSVGGDYTAISYPSSYISVPDQANWSDEWARFLYSRADTSTSLEGKQSIRVHAVAVTGASSDGNYPNFIQEIARQGGGEYYAASDVDTLTTALLSIFNGMLAVNSVFASAALPISTNAQGTYDNQVFVGLFRPDAKARPRWNGNLKQYKFGYDAVSDKLTLVDSSSPAKTATSATTGFLQSEAVSFWTTSSTFWTNSPTKTDGVTSSASDSPDGAEVERGGVAQHLRANYATSQAGRKVLTCVSCSAGTVMGSSASTLFNTANTAVTQGALGAASSTERTDLIDWVRGKDNVASTNKGAEVAGPGSPATVRPSIHGDVLHSRPVVVNYGGTTGTVVFYGSNDGMLHAVYGRQDGNGGDDLWSFLPEEHFGKLRRLRNNSPEIVLPGMPAESGAQLRDYMVDGPIAVYRNSTTGKVWLFIGMRRGGSLVYALDVSDPLVPKFMWRKNFGDSDFEKLGQTWSMPKVALVKSLGKEKPVLVMGGGYDTVEDSLTPGSTSKGNFIYVLDAQSGALLRKFETKRSVPADVSLMDSDGDGIADRAYVADIGANLYRIDFEGNVDPLEPDKWGFTLLAELGDEANTRKVFFGPSLVQISTFTAVLFGTGDREKPLLMTSDDAFFLVKDRKTSKGAPDSVEVLHQSDLSKQTACSKLDAASCEANKNADAITDEQGCYLAFSGGERVVNGAVSVAGFTYFGTNKPTPPSANSCSGSLGEARSYAFPLFCAPAKYGIVTGGGLLPTPVTGYVEVGDVKVPFLIGGGDDANRISPSVPRLPTPQVKRRTYWFIDNQGR